MLRLMLRLIAGLVPLLLLPMVVIRAQPYDDGGLAEFLRAGACAAPCFLDIQPGVTAMYRADLMLSDHAWIGHVERNRHTLLGEPATVSWTWNGGQPHFFADDGWGSAHSNNGILVDDMAVETRLSLGDLWLSLGPPLGHEVTVFGGPHGVFLGVILRYPDLSIPATIRCPYHKTLWYTRGVVRFQTAAEVSEAPPAGQEEALGRQALELEEEFCPR